jgi:hypothetical protein
MWGLLVLALVLIAWRWRKIAVGEIETGEELS